MTLPEKTDSPTRIVIELADDQDHVDATLFLNGVPVAGRGDRTGTLSTRQLAAPLIDQFDAQRRRRRGFRVTREEER